MFFYEANMVMRIGVPCRSKDQMNLKAGPY